MLYLTDRVRSGGVTFAIAILFDHERLEEIHLGDVNPEFGTSWDDWSEAKELKAKASHDRWLRCCVGGRRNFPWGGVWSGYDERSGSSAISVRYWKRLRQQPRRRPIAMPADTVAKIEKVLKSVMKRAPAYDRCNASLHSQSGFQLWLEFRPHRIMAVYPFGDKPTRQALESIGVPSFPQQKLLKWRPGETVSFGHAGAALDRIAAFIAAYFRYVLEVSPARRDLHVEYDGF